MMTSLFLYINLLLNFKSYISSHWFFLFYFPQHIFSSQWRWFFSLSIFHVFRCINSNSYLLYLKRPIYFPNHTLMMAFFFFFCYGYMRYIDLFPSLSYSISFFFSFCIFFRIPFYFSLYYLSTWFKYFLSRLSCL